MKHLPREMEESVAKPAPIVCHWRAHGVETQKESHLGCQRLRDEPCSDTEISCLTPDKPLDHAVLVSQRVKRWKKHCLTQPWDVFIKEKKKMKVITTFQVEKYAARVQVRVVRSKEEKKKVERKFGSKKQRGQM